MGSGKLFMQRCKPPANSDNACLIKCSSRQGAIEPKVRALGMTSATCEKNGANQPPTLVSACRRQTHEGVYPNAWEQPECPALCVLTACYQINKACIICVSRVLQGTQRYHHFLNFSPHFVMQKRISAPN